VSTVELGGRRRWALVAAGALVAWVLVAVVVGSGGGSEDDEGEPAPAAPTTTPATSTTAPPGEVVGLSPQEPSVADLPPGVHLVLLPGSGSPLDVDLATGTARELPFPAVVASQPDGLFTASDEGAQWRPFPFDEATAVPLAADGAVIPVPGEARAWVWSAGRATLVSLADGSEVARRSLPAAAEVVGAVPAGLVVVDGGDTFVLGVDGGTAGIDGEAIAVTGDAVVVRRCDGAGSSREGELDCAVVAVDVAVAEDTGSERRLRALDSAVRLRVDAVHPDGRPLVRVEAPGDDAAYGLLGVDGVTPVLPPGVAPTSGHADWTPDGELLVVRTADVLRVVDPFADGGPVEVGSFQLARAIEGLYLVGPPS
jgi:hypothetical protein